MEKKGITHSQCFKSKAIGKSQQFESILLSLSALIRKACKQLLPE